MTLPAKESRFSPSAQNQVTTYRDLIAWQRAIELGLDVYRLTALFPDHERYGLSQQLRRAAVSVASNIAEGYGRASSKDYVRFLKFARGGLCEVETHLLFSRELEYITPDQYAQTQAQIDDCQRVLFGLIRSIKIP
jgi:four helix bundle protein